MTLSMESETTKSLHFRNHRPSSVLTGVSLVLLALVAGVAYGYLHPQIVVAIPSAAMSYESADVLALFRIEVLCWWLIALLDVVISAGIFFFFRSTSPSLSVLTTAARLLYTAFLVLAVLALSSALTSTGLAGDRLRHFESLWSNGLVVFGFHLILLAILAWKSRVVPGVLAFTVGLGGLCYVVVHTLKAFPGTPSALAGALEPFLALPMALGELWFSVWLVHGFFRNRD